MSVALKVRAPLGRRVSRHLRPLAYLWSPVGLLVVFFVAPMAILLKISFEHNSLYDMAPGLTLSNYASLWTDPIYRQVAVTTFIIATASMALQLLIALPLAYVLAFRAGRFELPLLLALVLADELNPIVRIYAWRTILGRDGIINDLLQTVGLTTAPVSWLLFSKFAVIVTLSTGYLTYTVVPVYAAMKAIDPRILESATDLGARFTTTFRRIVLPMAAPGIFVAMILVYIPLFSEFAAPTLLGGRSSYMLGSLANSEILEVGDWGAGAALNFAMLVGAGLLSVAAYYLARLNQLSAEEGRWTWTPTDDRKSTYGPGQAQRRTERRVLSLKVAGVNLASVTSRFRSHSRTSPAR